METLVKSTLEEAKRDKEIALETLRVESAQIAAEKETSREKALRSECDLEVQRVRDVEFEARIELTTRLESEFQERLQGMEERHEGVVTDLKNRHDEVRTWLHRLICPTSQPIIYPIIFSLHILCPIIHRMRQSTYHLSPTTPSTIQCIYSCIKTSFHNSHYPFQAMRAREEVMREELTELSTSHADLLESLKQHHAQSTSKAKTTAEEAMQGVIQEWSWKLDQKQREMIKAVDHANENLQARHHGAFYTYNPYMLEIYS